MLDKTTYHRMKREIKAMCKNNLIDLCDEVGLNDFERNLLYKLYDGYKQIEVCMELNISSNTHTNYLKTIMTKIYNYKNTPN